MKYLIFIFMLLPLASHAAEANYYMIKLMQPKNVITHKIDGIDGMSEYIKKVEVDINKELANVNALPSWGFLVIAVREDGNVRVWVDTDDEIALPVQEVMTRVAEETKSFKVKSGAVVFAIGFGVSGGVLPMNVMPFPNEWKQIANCTNEDCEGLDTEVLALKSW